MAENDPLYALQDDESSRSSLTANDLSRVDDRSQLSDSTASSSSSGSESSDSYMTDDSSTTMPYQLDDSTVGGVSFDRSSKAVDTETDDFSELTDGHDYRDTLGPLPSSLVSKGSTLDTQKLVQTSSDINPKAFEETMRDYHGVLSDSSFSGSPWVDGSDTSSSMPSQVSRQTSFASHSEYSREVSSSSTSKLHRIVSVAKEGSHQSKPIDVHDIESGCLRRADIEVASATTRFELSTVEPMPKNVARDAFVKNNKRTMQQDRNKKPRHELATRPVLSISESSSGTPSFMSGKTSSDGWANIRNRTRFELFFLIVIVVSLVCLVVLLSLILLK